MDCLSLNRRRGYNVSKLNLIPLVLLFFGLFTGEVSIMMAWKQSFLNFAIKIHLLQIKFTVYNFHTYL